MGPYGPAAAIGNTRAAMSREDISVEPESALAAALAFALDRSSDRFPQKSRRMAALLLLDTLGVCAAAQPMQPARIARQTALRIYNTHEERDSAPLLFDGRKSSRAGAAFAAATQIDNLDAHDGYNPTRGHIGVAVVPALFVMGHDRPDLSGAEALAALIVGYEIAGRAGLALHDSACDYHTSGAWNALGVAALAARLDGAGNQALRHAWGIAEYHGPRSQMMREIANPSMLHDGSGMGALVGLSALIMARMGFTGAPALTIESDAAAPHWADLGAFWQIDHQYIKPYPICRWAHGAIDAVRALRVAHDFTADDIAGIEIRSFHNAVRLFSQMPETTSQAQYSMAFAVAVMATYGQIALEHISGDGLADPLVAALVARTRAIEAPAHQARFPEGRWADVEITLHSGAVLSSGDTHARGGPEHPMDATEIEEKYFAYAAPVLGYDRAAQIRDATLALAEGGDFAALARLLVDAP